MLSTSRGAIFGIVAGGIMAAVYLRRYISGQMLMRAAFAVLAFTLVATLFVFSTEFGYLLEERMTRGVTTGDVETLSSGRTAIWTAALREMADYPVSFISGLGWEAYFQTIGHRYATHSVYLDRFYNLGLIGLILFTYSFAGAAAIARRGLATPPTDQAPPFIMATVIGIAAFMIAMAFSDIHGAALYVWAMVGVALRVASSSPASQDLIHADQRGARP
jgi:O-antigen ligase